MDGPLYVIVNPQAGGGRTERLWPQLQRRLDEAGFEYTWHFTDRPRDATRLARQAPPGAAVIVVGGDGTLNECAAGLPAGATLGVIPTGTCNDFARSLGVSVVPTEAARELASCELRPLDLPELNGIPLLSSVGVGYGVDIARSTTAFARRISVVDLARLFRALPRLRTPEISVDLDGRRSTGRVFLLAVGNGRYFSGGLNLCPGAHYDDGLLDVLIAGDLRRAEAVLALTCFFRGTHVRRRKFHYTKAHVVHIEGPEHVPIHADGHPVRHLPATVSVRHRALNVLVPPGRWQPSKVRSIWQKRGPAPREVSSP